METSQNNEQDPPVAEKGSLHNAEDSNTLLSIAYELFALGKRCFDGAKQTSLVKWILEDNGFYRIVYGVGGICAVLVWILCEVGFIPPSWMPDRFENRAKLIGGIVLAPVLVVTLVLFLPSLLAYLVGGVLWVFGKVIRFSVCSETESIHIKDVLPCVIAEGISLSPVPPVRSRSSSAARRAPRSTGAASRNMVGECGFMGGPM